MDIADSSQQSHNPGRGDTDVSVDLKELIDACNDVDEFRALLHERGIWLNRNAAESAFQSLRRDDGEALDDEALRSVSGGVGVAGVPSAGGDGSAFLTELLRFI